MKTVGLQFPRRAEEKHLCPVCGKEYKTKQGLEKHMEEESHMEPPGGPHRRE